MQQPQRNNSQNKNQTQTLTWPAPPIYLMKQMDTMLFQQSQSIDEIKNRLNHIEMGSLSESGLSGLSELSELDLDQIKPALMADDEFLVGIVDHIMTNSNLSEIIEQIDVVQSENRELRELFYAQQKTINEMNIMLLKVFSQGMTQISSGPVLIAPEPPLIASNSNSDAPDDESKEEPEEDGSETIQLETSDMQIVD